MNKGVLVTDGAFGLRPYARNRTPYHFMPLEGAKG